MKIEEAAKNKAAAKQLAKQAKLDKLNTYRPTVVLSVTANGSHLGQHVTEA